MAKQTKVLQGVGEIFAGDRLIRNTSYRLEVSSCPASPGAPHTIVDASIDISTTPEAFVLARAGTLTLCLEDGRSIPFTLDRLSGRIVVHGELPPVMRSSAR
jgi:hypothetical protein